MQVPFVASWWPTFGEPDVVLSLAYSSQAFYNETGWIDPKLDELIAAGRAEQDDAMRKTIYTEVQQLISEQRSSRRAQSQVMLRWGRVYSAYSATSSTPIGALSPDDDRDR